MPNELKIYIPVEANICLARYTFAGWVRSNDGFPQKIVFLGKSTSPMESEAKE